MNNQQLITILKALEIAKSQITDIDKVLYSSEIEQLQKIQDTIMHLEFYLDTRRL